jgi:hypothetical protein
MIILPSKSDSSAHFAIEHQVVQVGFSFTWWACYVLFHGCGSTQLGLLIHYMWEDLSLNHFCITFATLVFVLQVYTVDHRENCRGIAFFVIPNIRNWGFQENWVHMCHAILSFLGVFWLSLGVHWQESNVILSTCDLGLSGGIGNVFWQSRLTIVRPSHIECHDQFYWVFQIIASLHSLPYHLEAPLVHGLLM